VNSKVPGLTRGMELDSSRFPSVIMHTRASYTPTDWNQLMKGMIELVQAGPFGLINDTRGSPHIALADFW